MGKLYSNLFDCVLLTHFFTNKKKRGENDIKIDKEYSCVWFEECDYLIKHGIRYTFVKEINGITTWKFKKDEYLFRVLADFYSNVYSK